MADEESNLTVPALGRVNTRNSHFNAEAQIRQDGRVNIHLSETTLKLAKYLEKSARQSHGKIRLGEYLTRNNKQYESVAGKFSGIPRINIAIHIVGSRGDVQPFIPIAKILSQPPYGHRVRICTHPVFKDLVEENGLEFFSIGGDPASLMAYMVKNPGLIPGIESLKAGDVGKRRSEMAEILEGCWRSCIEPGNGMEEKKLGVHLSREVSADQLFIADAIIANPPSYGHIHCAEKLGIPLHMMFTMPWSPTQYFPHPLASMDRNDSDPNFANYISYTMMELLAWQGLGDVINNFRTKTLHLDPISPLWGHVLLSRMKVPFTYLWSSALIPKPLDWGSHINISGFSFLNQASSYKPPDDLMEFLNTGPPPIYIGFGSIVVDHPEQLTKMIFGAVKRAGVRAIVSKGWGGLGGNDVPEGVYLIGNCPHDWLFQHVSCVVHHGGAGTTAIGIALGKPTVIVPFFGDQPFWGAMIYRAGAGPEPVPFKKTTEESLANSITAALGPEIQMAVKEMAEKIAGENGAADAAASFQKAANMDTMRCMVCPDRVAVWRIKKTNIRLSSVAATILMDNQRIRLGTLKLVRHRDWYVDEGAGDPVTGTIAVASGTITNSLSIMVDYYRDVSNALSKTPERRNSDTIIIDDAAELARLNSFAHVVSRHPIRHAATYTPEQLEGLAYRMASKTLPSRMLKGDVRIREKKKSLTWPITKRTSSNSSNSSEVHQHGRVHDVTIETRDFAREMISTGLKVPVSFFYNLANGFHNAPYFLLNDPTVRRRSNITGFGSGLSAAGKELTLGLYDALSGLIIQPYIGAESQGVIGFTKGIGKGVGGLVFKSGAAAFGVPGYSLKGVERMVQKRRDRGLKAHILATRMRQGLWEFGKVGAEEEEAILRKWGELGIVL